MSGKIKEYVNKKILKIPIEVRQAQKMILFQRIKRISYSPVHHTLQLWSTTRDLRIKAEQQNAPSCTIIQLYPLTGCTGAGSPGKSSND
jgi:hypothetical protein